MLIILTFLNSETNVSSSTVTDHFNFLVLSVIKIDVKGCLRQCNEKLKLVFQLADQKHFIYDNKQFILLLANDIINDKNIFVEINIVHFAIKHISSCGLLQNIHYSVILLVSIQK